MARCPRTTGSCPQTRINPTLLGLGHRDISATCCQGACGGLTSPSTDEPPKIHTLLFTPKTQQLRNCCLPTPLHGDKTGQFTQIVCCAYVLCDFFKREESSKKLMVHGADMHYPFTSKDVSTWAHMVWVSAVTAKSAQGTLVSFQTNRSIATAPTLI